MIFNEDSRVKIPTILHLIRLGYQYHSLKNSVWDKETNIFPELFRKAIARINPDMEERDIERLMDDVKLSLDNEDLGKVFYGKLVERSSAKLIDFVNFSNNSFHVVTELTYKNGDDEFRPDITLLINGMPLVFIEVKKPNNKEGILVERNRIIARCRNPRFRRFINITQLMVFSNNMEYDDSSSKPIQGAFYASPSYGIPIFNYFREEEHLDLLPDCNNEIENDVLRDTNLNAIKHSPEFLSNKSPNTPTNRICTSLFSLERLSFLLQYALTYVHEVDGLQKHVMRYPQLFATKAIEKKLNSGIRKGIIWHTQGSGKTALAYYNVRFLTDYFQQRSITPKFYFIVDRIDLLIQAQREFSSRGLIVHTIETREAFAHDIKATQAIHNYSGKQEITVVNIQKFQDDPDVVRSEDYNVDIQRVYFLDEVHRSYNPRGSFLANLSQSDQNAIKIGLTGTPLLGDDYNSRALFGDYIHKYYYNSSIADGYTLRLIREEIASNYKLFLQEALATLELQQGDLDRKELYACPRFVEPMLDYIIDDFEKSRDALNDSTIGAMVICDSAKQAQQMFETFQARLSSRSGKFDTSIAKNSNESLLMVAESIVHYTTNPEPIYKVKSGALILHDVGSKKDRKDWMEKFKAGKIDILFVYNMLLTGFDAKRLKKLYLGRVIRKHNLLQALTRVNRPYKDFHYGYVVDFADIRKEFDATNKAYFDELQAELGDEIEHYSHLFKTPEEIALEIENIKDILFRFDIENAEVFSQQICQIQDRATVLAIKKALTDARSLYNLIRLQGEYTLLKQLDFQKLNQLYHEASNHLDLLNLKESIESSTDTTNLLYAALEDVIFLFTKVKEEELVLADKLKNTLRQTREALTNNFDQHDPKFIALREELERLFKKKNLNEVTKEEMNANIEALNEIHEKVKKLNRENCQIQAKYDGDAKYCRVHKRLLERGMLQITERNIFEALSGLKQQADQQVLQNTQLLTNESYFERMMMPLVINEFHKNSSIRLSPDTSRTINGLVVAEYMNEFTSGNRTGARV